MNSYKTTEAPFQKIFSVDFICLLYITLWMTVPNMAGSVYFRLAALGCGVMLLLLRLFSNTGIKISSSIIAGAFFVIIICIFSLIQNTAESSFMTTHIWLLVSLLLAIMGNYYINTSEKKSRAYVDFCLLVFSVIAVFTIIACVKYPGAARYSGGDYSQLRTQYAITHLVGGFGVIYLFAVVSPLLLAVLVSPNTLSTKEKKFFICSMILQFIAVIMSGFMLALSAVVLGVLVVLLLKNPTPFKIIMLFIISLLIFIFLNQIIESVLSLLLKIFSGTPFYYQKVRDIYRSLYTTTSGFNTFKNRLEVYKLSIDQILRHPILGIWHINDAVIGEHSAIFDTLAEYGIVLFPFFISFYFHTPFKIADKKGYSIEKSVLLIVMIFLCLFNPMPNFQGILLFLIYPAISRYYITSPIQAKGVLK